VTTHAVSHVVYDTAALDWAPLERFLAAATQRGVAAPDPDEFMWMGQCELADGPIIHLYKHVDSRRYLNLDHAGFAYRYHARDYAGLYEPFDSPLAALDDVIGSRERDAACIVLQLATPSSPASPGPSLTL
jgi:predicted ATPase